MAGFLLSARPGIEIVSQWLCSMRMHHGLSMVEEKPKPSWALITVRATLSPYGSTPQLAVVDSKALGVDQRIAKPRQTSNEVSDRKTAPPRWCRLHA
jgi:hypothetical protein